jgi:YggT family protein
MLAYLIHLVFLAYTLMIFVRVVGSWFSSVAGHPIMHFVSRFTDPYLNTFRKLIPPIGGSFDLSPLLGFFALQIGEQFLLSFFR